MTREEFRARVIEYALAGVQGADQSTLIDQGIEVDTLNANVLQEFADRVSRDGDQFFYLQTLVNLTITSQVGVLPNALFGESLRWGMVRDDQGNICSQVRYLADMYRPLNPDFTYYCLATDHIYFRERGNPYFDPILPMGIGVLATEDGFSMIVTEDHSFFLTPGAVAVGGGGAQFNVSMVVNYQPTLDTLYLVPDTLTNELLSLAVARLREAMAPQGAPSG